MTEKLSENELIQQRRAKLEEIRKKGIAYPNSFRRDSLSADLQQECAAVSYTHLTLPTKA